MKSIVLKRRISVRCWNVIGVVAKATERAELMPVLLRARGRNPTTAEDVAEHLFFEQRSRRVVAERLLRIAVNHGLLAQNERWFTLTNEGFRALGDEQVFVPERGSWTIWASNDPLLAYPILRVERWIEPTALEDVQRGKNKDRDAREFRDLPRTVRNAERRVATPPCGDGGRLRVDEVAPKAEEVEPGDDLRVVWTAGETSMRLEGSLRGMPANTVLDAPRLTREDAWRRLLEAEGLWSRWDSTRSELLVGFDETNDRERESLRRDLAIATPTLGELGKFDALTIQDVPITASSVYEATRWAEWRLQARVGDYATRERFDTWSKEATEPFASSYRISVPSRADLAKAAWPRPGERPSPMAWHLAAAEDWSL